MRFHRGLPPDEFESTVGWNALREPSASGLARVSAPVGLILCFGALAGWHLLDVPVLGALQVRGVADVLTLILGFTLLIVVHELVHAGLHPGWGVSRSSVLGASLRPMLVYASYQGAMSRDRFLAVLLAPFAVLTVLPLAMQLAGAVPGRMAGAIAAASSVNAVLSGADVLGALMVAWQVPRGGTVRNKGWQTFWRDRPGRSRPAAG